MYAVRMAKKTKRASTPGVVPITITVSPATLTMLDELRFTDPLFLGATRSSAIRRLVAQESAASMRRRGAS